jgi:hypothetical protein
MKTLMTLLGAALTISGCAVGPSTDDCPDPPVTPITINFTKNTEIKVNPPNARPYLGNVLKFNLVGDKDTMVTIKGKSGVPDSSWISASGKGGPLYVCVKNDLIEEETYRYEITVDGVGYLDPEVTIRRRR